MTSLTFLGAARTVTGSKYLLDTGASKVLIDAGLFQGLKELRERNWLPFLIPATEIDAIVLTHAHLDHCGYLPRLVSQGFRGRVFCTAGTLDHCRILVPDAGRIQEEDAANANQRDRGRGHALLGQRLRQQRKDAVLLGGGDRLRNAGSGAGRYVAARAWHRCARRGVHRDLGVRHMGVGGRADTSSR